MHKTKLSTLIVFLISGAFFMGIFVGSNNTKDNFDTKNFSVQEKKFERYTPIIRKDLPSDFKDVNFNEFFEVWRTIEEHYVPKPELVDNKISETKEKLPTREEVLWNSIRGITHSIEDPYTVFLPPVESVEFNKEIVTGDIEGIGVYIGNRNNVLTVISPIKNTPAHRAGLKSRDVIVEIDGKTTKDLSVYEASKLIRGEVGSTVVLGISRKGNDGIIDISVERGVIQTPNVEYETKDNVFIITVSTFNEKTPRLFSKAMREFYSSDTNKLIIDLRNNPGGILDVAVFISSFFVEKDTPILYQYDGDGSLVTYATKKSRDKYINEVDPKIFVLVNGASASASEILAGALRHHTNAVLLGTNTFGKGSIQELIPIAKNSTLKLTIAHWLLPDKSSISDKGIEVDIEYENPDYDNEVFHFDDEGDLLIEFALKEIKK